MKQRWQTCFEAHRDANLKTPASATNKVKGNKQSGKASGAKPKMASKPRQERGKFVIGGLQLGGNINSQKNRLFLLEAYGYHKKTKAEHYDLILSKGKKSRPGPDVIRNYKGAIKEAPVYISFEAASDGSIYMIQFKQKERMEVDQVKDALIKRFGRPDKHHGNYLYWGCERGPQEGFCVKANASAYSMEIWAFDGDIKDATYKAYGKNVLKSKGIKSGPKF